MESKEKATLNKVICLLLIYGIYGCENRIDANCSKEENLSIVKGIVRKEVENKISNMKNKDGSPTFSTEKYKDILNKITVSIEDIRTTKKDQESTKASCTGTYVISATKEIIDQAEKGRNIAKLDPLSDYAKNKSIQMDANRFLKEIDYNVQPTDNGEKIFAELNQAHLLSDLTEEIITPYLIVPIIEDNAKKQEGQNNLTQLKDKAMEATNIAGNQLQMVWDSASDNIKSSLLQDQLDWRKKSEAKCREKAENENNDDITKDIIYFNCLREDNNQRTEILKQKIDSLAQQ